MTDSHTVWGGKHYLAMSDTFAQDTPTVNIVFGDRGNGTGNQGTNRPGANVQLALNEIPVFAAFLMRHRETFALQRKGKGLNANWQKDNAGQPQIHMRFTLDGQGTISVPVSAGDIIHLRIRILSRLRLLYPETPSQLILAGLSQSMERDSRG